MHNFGNLEGVRRKSRWLVGAAAAAVASTWGVLPAAAADDAQIQQLQTLIQRLQTQYASDIKQLQDQLNQLKAQQAQQAQQPAQPVIQDLQNQITQLKAQQAQTQAQVQEQAPPAGTPRLIASPTHQFGFTSADGANSVAIAARLMIDGADYFHTVPQGGPAKGAGPGGTGGPLDSGVNARRARLGIQGTFENDWAYRLIYDFGSSADSTTPGVSGAVTSGVENAYVTYNGFYKQTNFLPVAIDLGYLDIPWTLDESTSSNDIMFLERSSAQVVATEFGGGDFRSGFGLRSNNQRYWAGVYLTGNTSGTPHTGANIGNYSVLGRAGYQVYQGDDNATVHLGVNGAHLFNARSNSTATAATSITDVATNANLALSDRPELRVDPTVLLNTGNIAINSGQVGGVEAAGTLGNFFVQGEYYAYEVSQRPGGTNPADGAVNKVAPDLNFQGGYVEASYSIGGHRRYIAETGAYSGVIPDAPFALDKGNPGAFELAVRYSTIDLNDKWTFGQAPHLTGGVNGGNQRGLDLGINWYPSINLKFMLDYVHTDVSDLYKASTGGAVQTTPTGATINAIAIRSQFLF